MRDDARQHFFMLKRFRHVIHAPGLKTLEFIRRIGQRRHENDRNFFKRIKRFEPAAGLESVNSGHHHVQQNQIRLAVFGLLNRAFAGARH